ncbi:L-glutamate gamma-semialdehyde dehydrogenase [Kitasatospora sp. NBC_01250]|uniref:L-glutamate gamma-semialdehyde dehydrogenase n=1 Tax=unclassified Kitasatospora TaxID=2633591 RepID=UPI002E122318|nr:MULTISPECIES: L-glutamate gamma-semialdehyde dehydrogenase [unclassified Kitasatospora]WSJ71903.1 L-glutamate gamma-semialdehyde dehydrogenase [Kitasatospora sp. NBC_01302]
MDAVTKVPVPVNEPVHGYAPGSPERARLLKRLDALAAEPIALPMTIGGEQRLGSGERIDVVQPHHHAARLGVLGNATAQDAELAVAAALEAGPDWRRLSFDDRAAVFLRAAELLAGPWRETLAAATMLGQSKTVQQAEIDAPCELVDFWRFNVHFARQILAEQPESSPGVWNRTDHRPLEGFVYAVTPFNFTAIAGNLPTAPALLGNTVVWKPAPTQTFAAHHLMRLLEAAGLPPGVINLVTGDGQALSRVALASPDLAGLHFTGSSATFRTLWQTIGANLAGYRGYPRIVGETGGKDFLIAHPSADPATLTTALIRGAFEYQGQKCSALSRAYLPRSLWARIKDELLARVDALTVGDVGDLTNFMGALIDARAFAKNRDAIERAKGDPDVELVAGGQYDDAIGYFVRPTVLVGGTGRNEIFSTEYFGPILAVQLYEDARWSQALAAVDGDAPYGLTGAVFATDRQAIAEATEALRFAAGNFYVNDKPTGAVVGQQPFGGGRASGTNDKAGAAQNLLRWTSARTIKETFVPPTQVGYPHLG